MPTRQGIFLADGTSDLPLSRHIEQICADAGVNVTLTPVDPHLLPRRDRTVRGRLAFLVAQRSAFDIIFVHRDAEGEPPAARRNEVAKGAASAGVTCPTVPVVPVRMTEAWLLLDEAAIRTVAAKPRGRTPLHLPTPAEAERLSDPKAALAEALLNASETTGRRRQRFARDFDRHRRLLIERLNPAGAVSTLKAWRQLVAETRAALDQLRGAS